MTRNARWEFANRLAVVVAHHFGQDCFTVAYAVGGSVLTSSWLISTLDTGQSARRHEYSVCSAAGHCWVTAPSRGFTQADVA